MIVIDHAAVFQNRDLLMNRHAPDEVDYRDERKKEERGVTFEDFAKIPVLPRRSPWNTENEDVEAAKPKVSDEQVPLTKSNLSSSLSTRSEPLPNSDTTGSSVEDTVRQTILTDEILNQIVQTVIDSIPVVEFECPE